MRQVSLVATKTVVFLTSFNIEVLNKDKKGSKLSLNDLDEANGYSRPQSARSNYSHYNGSMQSINSVSASYLTLPAQTPLMRRSSSHSKLDSASR